MLSKQFTRREKVLLIFLGLLLLFAVYYFAVQRPVAEQLAYIRGESENVAMELTVLEAKQQRLAEMKTELESIMQQPDAARIPPYDNLEQVMAFLNPILLTASDYTLSFEGTETDAETNILRRGMSLSFTCSSYNVARDMVLRLQACPYRCQMTALSMSPAQSSGAQPNNARPLTSGSVTVSLRMVFFETYQN